MTRDEFGRDAAAIAGLLPHRYPFLLVDRITSIDGDRRIVGIKSVSADEANLTRGPDGRRALPSLVLLESIAQVGAILLRSRPEHRDRLVFFMGIEHARFRGFAHAGDTVELEVIVRQFRGVMGRFTGTARIGATEIARGTMSFAVGPEKQGRDHTASPAQPA
jgi:3-hydroxyacyl-[acyl-carrier-protein] dehydratase